MKTAFGFFMSKGHNLQLSSPGKEGNHLLLPCGYSEWKTSVEYRAKGPVAKSPGCDFTFEAYRLIHNLLPEFDRIWNATSRSTHSGKLQPRQYSHKQEALDYFDRHTDWKWISRSALANALSGMRQFEFRDRTVFRGKLLQEIFAERFPMVPKVEARVLENVAARLECV